VGPVALAALVAVLVAGHAAQDAAGSTVHVTVTDGTLVVSPGEVPVGKVVFKVSNHSSTARSFAIGRRRVRAIPSGRSARLTVTLGRRGTWVLVSRSRRAGSLSGVLAVFEPCTRPRTTTVGVRMDHDRTGITLSQTAIPCGMVTFVVTNIGTAVDSFQVFAEYPAARGVTGRLDPGETARLAVRFARKGTAYYQSGDYPPGEPEFGGTDADGGTLRVG